LAGLEVKMATPRQSDRRKGDRRESDRRKGDVRIIEVRGEGDKGQEVTVRHPGVPQKKDSSVWSGREKFTREWSETFITKKKGKNRKRGK
jgi:hypothetical protein